MSSNLTLEALKQVLWVRKVKVDLVHHRDHGSQYFSIRYSERLTEAGIEASVESVGDAYDNPLAETVNRPYNSEVIRRQRPWKRLEMVGNATLVWGHWINNDRLIKSIGNIPTAEYEKAYYTEQDGLVVGAGLK